MEKQLMRLPENPDIRLVKTPGGEVTLSINAGQSMQGWERALMEESADLLCQFGSEFLEAGLGLGLSALRIAHHPNTRRHVVVEIYDEVIRLFRDRCSAWPSPLEVVRGDFFDYIRTLQPGCLDGLFFDPALPEATWSDAPFWDEMVPLMARALRPGGALVPFFSTVPVLRWQYVPFFERGIVLPRAFTAYADTGYTSATSGRAFIQCFVKASDPTGNRRR
jgi:spermidine synthase